MLYKLSTLSEIDLAPADTVHEVLQNVRTIISTARGSVPLDRDFGISWEAVDQPTQMAQMTLRTEIVKAIQTYEPRAKVKSITFTEGKDLAMAGHLVPVLIVEVSS